MSKNVPVLPKILPSKTLDTVARYGLPNFPRNRYSKSTAAMFALGDICDEIPALDSFSAFGQSEKFGSL